MHHNFLTMSENGVLLPGALEFVKKVKAEIPKSRIYIAANGATLNAKGRLASTGLDRDSLSTGAIRLPHNRESRNQTLQYHRTQSKKCHLKGLEDQSSMDCQEAIALFESVSTSRVVHIERCATGMANYVFIVFTEKDKFVLRCSKDENAYQDTVYWLGRLAECDIPIPTVLSEGQYGGYVYLILSYFPGEDLGDVYGELKDSEKRQIAGEVVRIQRKVSKLEHRPDPAWTWNRFVDEMLDVAETRIQSKHYFDPDKVRLVRKLQKDLQDYLDQVPQTPYLDDISTKNLLIHGGKVSGIIDIDGIGFGDWLTFAALSQVALLNMDQDTSYIDYLLDEIRPTPAQRKAFIFYCLLYCVDFMGERGMQFLDKTVPVDENVIRRLNGIFDLLMEEWRTIASPSPT